METYAIGAILIGGASRRMGTDKAAVEVSGVPMVRRVAAALVDAGLEVVTIGAPDRVDGFPNYPDPPQMSGPLAGLASALEHSDGRPVVLVAVDQPLVQIATLRGLMSIHTQDAVVPFADGFPQVTCALYRTTCLPAIRRIASVNPEASIRDLLGYINVRELQKSDWEQWGEDGRSWKSIDTPADLAAIEATGDTN